MIKRRQSIILFSFLLIPVMFGLLFLDLAGIFMHSDFPFLLMFVIYGMYIIIQRSSSRTSFMMALYLLIIMGLSYIKTGPVIITERLGEWFYIFFIFGLLQNAFELRKIRVI